MDLIYGEYIFMKKSIAICCDSDIYEMLCVHAQQTGYYELLFDSICYRQCLTTVLDKSADIVILQLQESSDVAGCLDMMNGLDAIVPTPLILLFEKCPDYTITYAVTDSSLIAASKELKAFFEQAVQKAYCTVFTTSRPAALERELVENSILGREAALMEILRGCSSDDISMYKKIYSLDLRGNGYYLFFWELQKTEYHNHFLNKDVYNLMGRILERKYLSVLGDYEGGEEFRVNLDRRCIIINDLTIRSEAAKYFRLEELIQRLIACGNCKTASHYISERVDKLVNVRFARDRYENEKSSIFFLRYDGIIRADKVRQLKAASPVTLEHVLPYLQKISNYIRYDIHNPLLITELHTLYFEVIKPSMNYTLYYYCLASICSELVKETGTEKIGMLTDNLTPELMRFSSIEEQYDIIANYISGLRKSTGFYLKNSGSTARRAVDFINAHYAEDLTIPQIADAIYVSHMYLSKAFRKVLGTSVINYLIHVRIEKAKESLESSELPVYKVADSVGFNDIKHCSKTFKSIVGVSPSEYRRKQKSSKS